MATAVAFVVVFASTDLHAPPRFDGAGYSVLALAIKNGHGYREITGPVERPHGHFPPGYPLVLAGLWTITGRSVEAAHLLAILCTTLAVWLASRWFLTQQPHNIAVALGFALAINWTWALNGGVIQSEPLFLLLSMIALLRARRSGVRASAVLGFVLGFAVLTRHVGVCLAAAVIVHQAIGKRWRDAMVTALTCGLVIAPWALWLATLQGSTQAGLFKGDRLLSLIGSQTIFYARRIPDALFGPFVEVATVFGKSRTIGILATLGACLITGVIGYGCVRAVRSGTNRLAGLALLSTIGLLLIWPFTEAGRFLVPTVPLLLLAAFEGAAAILTGRTRIKKSQIAWLLLLVSLPYPAYSLMTRRAEAGRRTHAEFDAACAWIAGNAKPDWLVMTRHPGEVFWQTGRKAIEPVSSDLEEVNAQVDQQNVAYLLVDPDRFANAPETPLAKLVKTRPERFREVKTGAVRVYELKRRGD